MHIAVNTRFLMPGRLEGFGHYTQEILRRITTAHPEDQFDFYFDRPFSQSFLYAGNVRATHLFPPARHPLLFRVWYQWRLRAALRTSQPDVFFSPDSFMPLNTGIPSVITVHDIAHRRFPESVSPAISRYYTRWMPRFIEAADTIITVSHFSKDEIVRYYAVDPQKIHVVYNGIGSTYEPLNAEEKVRVRQQFSNGLPYFLFVGAIHPRKNVARLITAYDLFRRECATPVALVIAGRKSWDHGDVDGALAASRYKEDIIFTGYLDAHALAGVTAAAHALCYVSLYEGFGLPVAEAMACGVPVIVGRGGAPAEVAGDAGFLVDPTDTKDIASAMQALLTDQLSYERLSTAGLERSHMFSWVRAAEETYKLLVSTGS